MVGSQNRKKWEDMPIESLGAMLFDGHRITAVKKAFLSSLLLPREEKQDQSVDGRNDATECKKRTESERHTVLTEETQGYQGQHVG